MPAAVAANCVIVPVQRHRGEAGQTGRAGQLQPRPVPHHLKGGRPFTARTMESEGVGFVHVRCNLQSELHILRPSFLPYCKAQTENEKRPYSRIFNRRKKRQRHRRPEPVGEGKEIFALPQAPAFIVYPECERGGLYRTWPLPRMMYFSLVSWGAPIGPRACSFWVEMPISAPKPNMPPSVNRVDTLT